MLDARLDVRLRDGLGAVLDARLDAWLGTGLNEGANGSFLYDRSFSSRDRGSGIHASQRIPFEFRRFRCIFVSSIII